eukprot:PhM_4_TR16621/c0_g5_i1/m.59459
MSSEDAIGSNMTPSTTATLSDFVAEYQTQQASAVSAHIAPPPPETMTALRRLMAGAAASTGIDPAMRPSLWRGMLGVSPKTHDFKKDDSADTIPDAEVKATMRMDVELALCNVGLEGDEEATQVLENVLGHLMQKLGRTYTGTLCELATPLVSVLSARSSGVLFHVLYRIINTLVIPRFEAPTTTVAYLQDIHRLLLQYHDPALSAFFDQKQKYSSVHKTLFSPSGWHATIFSTVLGHEQVQPVWDYLVALGGANGEDGRWLVLFVGLAVLTLCRDSIMQRDEGQEEEDVELAVMRSGLQGVDVVKRTVELVTNTPTCTKRELRHLLSSSDKAEITKQHERLQQYVVLPVLVGDITEAFRTNPTKPRATDLTATVPAVRYVVLDCRAERSFNFAHLPTAVHIGPKVGFDHELLQQIIERFDAVRGSHFVVMGTGRGLVEESNLLNVLALHFVMSHFQHITVVEGGFKMLIPLLQAKEVESVQTLSDEELEELRVKAAKKRAEKELTTPVPTTTAVAEVTRETQEALKEKFEGFKSWGAGFMRNISDKIKEASNKETPQQVPAHHPTAEASRSHEPGLARGADAATASSSVSAGIGMTHFTFGANDDDDDEDDEFVIIHKVERKKATVTPPPTANDTSPDEFLSVGSNPTPAGATSSCGAAASTLVNPPLSPSHDITNSDIVEAEETAADEEAVAAAAEAEQMVGGSEVSNATVGASSPRREEDVTTTDAEESPVTPPPPQPTSREEKEVPPKKTSTAAASSNLLDDDFDLDSIELPAAKTSAASSSRSKTQRKAAPLPEGMASPKPDKEKHPFDDIFV